MYYHVGFLPAIAPLLPILGQFLQAAAIGLFAVASGLALQKALKKDDQNQDIRDKKKAINKDPNKINFPSYDPDQNKNTDPNKRGDNDPVADEGFKQKPTPNNVNNPIQNIPKRNIPKKTPTHNQTPTPNPYPDPVNVGKPSFFKRTGTFIYIPVQQVEVNLNSMPVNTATGVADWNELNNAHTDKNKLNDYLEYIASARTNQDKPSKLSDILPYIMSIGANVNGTPTIFSGTESLGKLQDAYDIYSNCYYSKPLDFIPTKINIKQVKGVINSQRRIAPEDFELKFEPENKFIPKILQDTNLFKIPKEINVEQLLEFAGNVSSYQGGADKWEQYRQNPNLIKNPDFFKVPSSSDILNEELPDGSPKYQKQNLKVRSQSEINLLLLGNLYTKAGLHEFPSEPLPSVKNPDPLPEGDTNQLNKGNVALRINNLATAVSYVMSWFNYKVGDFPAEVEIQDPQNPEVNKKEQVNISSALTGILALAGIGVALGDFNKNINLRNASEIEASKNAALKAADCGCANMANSGMNTSPKARCSPGAFNFTNAKGYQSMISGTLQEMTRCRQGVENQESATMKDMLQNIMFGVNIIKSAFFKGEKELENEQKTLKELLGGKINDKELDELIKKFNNQQTPQTKDYPIKSKIVKRPKGSK